MTSRPQPEPATAEASVPERQSTLASKAPALVSLDAELFKDVQVELRARLGLVTVSVDELLALRSGSVLKLQSRLNDLVELRLNDAVVALGEIVAVGDHFGLRIVDVASRT